VEASAVDDIVAETFAIAWRRLPARADPLPWLYGVARRVVHGHRRAHVRRAALTARLVSRHAATPPPGPAELIVDDPALAVAFATLTEREREAVRLVAWEGVSHTRALPQPPAASGRRAHGRGAGRRAHGRNRPPGVARRRARSRSRASSRAPGTPRTTSSIAAATPGPTTTR
jgi:hypothetical protein